MEKRIEGIVSSITEAIPAWVQGGMKWGKEVWRSKWFQRLWLAGLFLLGVGAWLYFFSLGNVQFNFHDWFAITGPRLVFLRNAITSRQWPLHIPETSSLNFMTDRFLAVPDQILSPQIFLLAFVPLGWFSMIQVLLLYAIGYWGLLKVKAQLSLSILPFTILFLLFNFNGHIVDHLAVGHLTWAAYFLLSWCAYLIIQLLRGDGGWNWIAKFSFLMFAIYLQGGFHQFVWLLMFITILALTRREYFWTLIGGATFSVVLCMARILPSQYLGEGAIEYCGGFQTLSALLGGMILPPDPEVPLRLDGMPSHLGIWEYSMYVGLAAALFLAYFGLYRWLKPQNGSKKHDELIWPVVVLTFFSIGYVFKFVRMIPMPLIQGERVSSRMIILPFLCLLFMAVFQYQQWLDKEKHRWTVFVPVTLGAVCTGFHDIALHFYCWKIYKVSEVMENIKFGPGYEGWLVSNRMSDTAYIKSLVIGAVISVCCAGFLAYKGWKAKNAVEEVPAGLHRA